jgi:hypothetical protein
MRALWNDLDAFYLEHERCGELDSGVKDGRVWVVSQFESGSGS